MSKRSYHTRGSGPLGEELVDTHVGHAKKRSKPLLREVHIDENAQEIGSSSADKKSEDHGPKKFKISADEAHMNGAPEGDIYDVAVVADEDLPSIDTQNRDDVEAELRETLHSVSGNDASWADRFNAVEYMRKVLLSPSHCSLISDDSLLLMTCLEFCLHALESLRSCSVRNSILALASMARLVPAVSHVDTAPRVLTALLNPKLIASGPRFICEQAEQLGL